MSQSLLRVYLPLPLRHPFDYLSKEPVLPWCRVFVPFGSRRLVALVIDCQPAPIDPDPKLKWVERILDTTPLFSVDFFTFLQRAIHYYHYYPGEVLFHALPPRLRKGESAKMPVTIQWNITEQGEQVKLASLNRARKQRQALQLLQHQSMPLDALRAAGLERATLRALEAKGWCSQSELQQAPDNWSTTLTVNYPKGLTLNSEQQVAIETIREQLGHFTPFMLEGVTGSGKTEVYLRLIETILQQGQQALVMVPEIGLTPQTVARFANRFNVPILIQHSAMNERQRLAVWLKMRSGDGAILIGTRSALFVPCQNIGIIIVDEEHDSSFKQQDGFRYHARDLAVLRAQIQQIPILLGSATPSYESLYNCQKGRYRKLTLTQRAGGARFADHHLLDIRGVELQQGLSPQLITLMTQHLARGEQVLLFLNRRGYAPALLCHQCGWVAHCPHCEIPLTVHQKEQKLRCHHCDFQRRRPARCPQCQHGELIDSGLGTEQLEQGLAHLLPNYRTIRIDRDTTRRKGELEQHLEKIDLCHYQILIGTQMLAKGHHFPNVTLVALIDVDSALFSPDFRAEERLSQLVTQVSGRAGRSDKQGTVVLQTHHPQHGLLQDLMAQRHTEIAEHLLNSRQQMGLPPYSYQALFRAEAFNAEEAIAFLRGIHLLFTPQRTPTLQLLGPLPAPMVKRAGRYRYLLLIQSVHRQEIARLITQMMPAIDALKRPRQLRWSLDVDPIEWY